MTVSIDLYNCLVNYPGLAALVAGRVTPIKPVEFTVLPAVSYFEITDRQVTNQQGFSNLTYPHFQIDCFGADPLSTSQTAEMVCRALYNWGHGAICSIKDDVSEPAANPNRYRVIVDVTFNHSGY